jgi:hypothetical protein
MDNMESKIIRALSNPYDATKLVEQLDQYRKLGTWGLRKESKFKMRDALVYCLAASGQSLMTMANQLKVGKQVAFKCTQKVKENPAKYETEFAAIYSIIKGK